MAKKQHSWKQRLHYWLMGLSDLQLIVLSIVIAVTVGGTFFYLAF